MGGEVALNYDPEIGEVLRFVGLVAMKIRSANWRDRQDLPDQPSRISMQRDDIREIEIRADAIHNIGRLGTAIADGRHEVIEAEAQELIDEYQANLSALGKAGRWDDPALLGDLFWKRAIDVFTAVRNKARAIKQATAQLPEASSAQAAVMSSSTRH